MAKLQKIFLARHGERADLADRNWFSTAENPGDPPLTPVGIQQARQLGLRLQGEEISHIYASPFLRTVQTAHEVAKILNLPVRVEYGFSEGLLTRLFPHGEPKMLSLADLKQQMPLVALEETSIWGRLNFPEQYSVVNRRVQETTRALLRNHPTDNVLLVGHGLSVEYMARAILPKEKVGRVSNVPYCSLATCVRDLESGKWDIEGVLWDDTFLKERQDAEDAKEQSEMWGLSS